jgi:phospholipid transport system substrate-binding protein
MAQGLPALVGSALIALLSAAVLFSCQKGPAPQTGEKIDNLVSALSTLAVPTAGPAGPIAVVKSSLSRALSTAQSPPAGPDRGNDRGAEIQRAAQDLFDFKEMARRALGQHWQALSPQERNEFVHLFTDVLNRSFGAIVGRYSGERMAFVENEVAEGYARVHSRVIQNDGPEISIEYRLFESGSRWAVYDVVFNGRSLVSNYRRQFDSLTRRSFDSRLLEWMRTEQSTRASELFTPPLRERWAADLVLGAALYGRRR